MVLRVRGSTGSLGKLNIAKRLWRQLALSDGMRRPVSDGMLYAPKLSTRFEAQEIKETGNEKD